MMKKKSIFLSFSIYLSMSVFCGCSSKSEFVYRTNHIPEGVFLDDSTSGTMLKLTPISEKEYIEANGVNVIEDKSLNPQNKYFSIFLLCCYHENPEDYHRVNFYGFKLYTFGNHFCSYLIPNDDSLFSCHFTPYTNGLLYNEPNSFTEEALRDDCIYITYDFDAPESDEAFQVMFIKPEYYDYDSYYYLHNR